MPNSFDAVTYFRMIAETLKDISQSGGDVHFTQVTSINQLEGFLAEMQYLQGYQLILMDSMKGRYMDSRSDNIINQKFITFFLLHHQVDAIFEGKNGTIRSIRQVGDKIIAKMMHDRRNYYYNMHLIDPATLTFEQVGPIGTNWFGLNYSFFMLDYPGTLTFNPNDYTDDDDDGNS